MREGFLGVKVVLIGGGGHCRSCIDVIQGTGAEIHGVLTPEPLVGTLGYERLGDDRWLEASIARCYVFLVAVGQTSISSLRKDLYSKVIAQGLDFFTAQSNKATISNQAQVGLGSILMPHAVVGPKVYIGENSIINTGAIIEHDVHIENHVHVAPGAVVNGGVKISAGSMIGSNAVILPQINIAADVIVGAGSVVTQDIKNAGTWIGAPARRVR
jgi:sugar O-acyltransferase (sialic acid O-acetyltransferase NeuD family)